jgi:hypothetical protein
MNPHPKKVQDAITPGEPTPILKEIDTSTPPRAVEEAEPEEQENEEYNVIEQKGKKEENISSMKIVKSSLKGLDRTGRRDILTAKY